MDRHHRTQSKAKKINTFISCSDFVYVSRKPIVLKGRLWIRQQEREKATETKFGNDNEKKLKENAKKTVETSQKLHNSKISVRNNSSVAFLNPTGFSGKHTVQKQIKDALKQNLRRRPEKQFGSKKQINIFDKSCERQVSLYKMSTLLCPRSWLGTLQYLPPVAPCPLRLP